MSYRLVSLLAAAGAVSGAAANAQTIGTITTSPTTTLTRAYVPPLATASFAPASYGGTFNGSYLTIGLSWAGASSPSAPVLLQRSKDSGIVLMTPQGIANGTYSVQLTIPWANAAGTVAFLRGGVLSNMVAQCAVQQQLSYAAGAPVQRCDTGPFVVSDGKLHISTQFMDGPPSMQINVSQITVNLLKY